MRVWFALALGCSDPAPPPPVAPKKVIPTIDWSLTGRVTPSPSRFPDAPPFEGGKDMLAPCGPQRPCAAERWTGSDGSQLDLLRMGDEIRIVGQDEPWNARWWSISGVLRACIGDPLSVPPTTEMASRRTLSTQGEKAHWTLHLQGGNRCGLSGKLILNAHKDKIDTDTLMCDEKAWSSGGRECAKQKLSAASSAQDQPG